MHKDVMIQNIHASARCSALEIKPGCENDDAVIESDAPKWQSIVLERWNRLGQEILGLGADRKRSLRAIGQECESLAAVVAWFHNQGNITRTAKRFTVSRKTLRARLIAWRREYPDLVPPSPEQTPNQ